jgi:quercetin dioxygenase-like cupin family protein
VTNNRDGEPNPAPGWQRLTWRDPDSPSESTVARRLREEGVDPYAWSNGPRDRYGSHEHGYDKVLMCAAGSITFRVGETGEALELRAGDGFVLPAGTSHAAVVGPNGCTCLEGRR